MSGFAFKGRDYDLLRYNFIESSQTTQNSCANYKISLNLAPINQLGIA